MIISLCGNPGDGKTAFATYIAIMQMLNSAPAINYLRQSAQGFERLGDPKTVVNDHLVYANYEIYLEREYMPPLVRKDISGWQIGALNTHFPTVYLPSQSLIILDEAQRYYDSNVTAKKLSPYVLDYYARHRHYSLDIVLISQRPVSINKAIRGLSERFIFPKVSTVRDRHGNIKTVFDCIEFDSTKKAEDYADNKSATEGSKRKQYVYNGNIFDCYSSKGFYHMYTQGRRGQDFYYGSGEGGVALTETIEAPKGFYITEQSRKTDKDTDSD